MAGGGSYLYVNVTEGTLMLPRHDGTGSRLVRPGEGFYGPAFYERYVLQGLLARQNAEIITVYGIVQETDLVPNDGSYVPYIESIWSTATLLPFRFQRGVEWSSGSQSYVITDTSCKGLAKYQLSFALAARPTDPVSVTYYFYTATVNPMIVTHKIQQTEALGTVWSYPNLEDLPTNWYRLPPQDQVSKLMQTSP